MADSKELTDQQAALRYISQFRLVVILSQINIFCHQLIQNMTTALCQVYKDLCKL